MFPLSAPQQIIWLQHQMLPESRAYYSTAVVGFHGEIDPALLRKCVTGAVDRNDAFRLRLCDVNTPIAYQEVVEVDFDIPEYDLRGAEDIEERRTELLQRQMHTEFDLHAAPLVRWTLVRLADDHWQLFMTEHHLVHDGRSTVAFLGDVIEQYAAEAAGRPFVAKDAPTYQDYVAYTTSDEYLEMIGSAIEWWIENLDGATFNVDFPTLGTQRSGLFDYRGGQYRQSLSAELMAGVRAAAQQSGHTVFAAMLAVYGELCRRHSGQDDLVIGIPLANRPAEFASTVGMMVNTVPVRLAIDPSTPAGEVGLDAMVSLFDAVDHEAAPVQDLVKALGLGGKGLDNPLFNVTFGMHDQPFPDVDVPGLSVDMQVALSTNSARFDLSVFVTPANVLHGGDGDCGYELNWDYSTQRFGPEDAERLASGFEALLLAYATHPLDPIGTLALDTVAPPVRIRHVEGDRVTDGAAPVTGGAGDEIRPTSADNCEQRAESPWLQAFRDILEHDDIDQDTDFFQAGGYSLLVPMLLSRYESLSGWRPPTSLLFEFSSPILLEAASAERRPAEVGVER
ncbi:condensation domain-containing protein [Streptomyces sp. WM6372]|uniref:condensation domain-containing protein n=1 Tax=Streptomyces sp. WM6372 TaxID=1415555 RepID=UPI0006ADCD76|nr:condensation domain-containing protein [Streptomyces sp. WM6372]